MARTRTVARTRFEAFLHHLTRFDDGPPSERSVDTARELYDGFGCAHWSEEMFLRMLMNR